MIKVSCIVPAYNEESRIRKILGTLQRSDLINEIIVVDDGSTDKTSGVVKECFPKVKVLRKSVNSGKANALITGAQEAKGEILFFCDADLTGISSKHIHNLITPVITKKTKMVVGYQEFMNVFTKRRSTKSGFTDFTKGIGGEKVLYKKEFFNIPDLNNSGYGLELKIIDYFKNKSIPFEYLLLDGVGHQHKIRKWGFRGIVKEINASVIFVKQRIAGTGIKRV